MGAHSGSYPLCLQADDALYAGLGMGAGQKAPAASSVGMLPLHERLVGRLGIGAPTCVAVAQLAAGVLVAVLGERSATDA